MTYKGISIMLTAGLSTKTLQARREWQDIFKVMKEKNIKSGKGKATNNIQGNSHEVISLFFSRNSTGQKGMAGYI